MTSADIKDCVEMVLGTICALAFFYVIYKSGK